VAWAGASDQLPPEPLDALHRSVRSYRLLSKR
jgi:hypothetical protein